VYEVCVGSACVPYAVDIFFDQKAIDSLASAGSAAVGIVASVLTSLFPSLAPYIGIVSSILAGTFVAMDTFAKNSCGGNGVGIYIDISGSFDIHC
jgi:hypothetical protein